MASETCSPSNKLRFLLGMVLFLLMNMTTAQLSSTFYSTTCPKALATIKSAVNSAVSNEARMGASLLRLHFHDCFVNGCDGSILLDDTANMTGEKTAVPNSNSVRGFEVIDTIKSQVESLCPGVVSCADIVAVAARDSVVALGGPSWTVLLGRRDSTTASLSAANSNIPAPTLNLSGLITAFSNKGFTAKEMVALSGSHTIGQARCTTFRTRIYNETNIDSTFATSLRANCQALVETTACPHWIPQAPHHLTMHISRICRGRKGYYTLINNYLVGVPQILRLMLIVPTWDLSPQILLMRW
ncbi:hypothetical protein ES288_D10G137500v1 [Gossypium darwinii]|uniref:Peroxidase n=1 Tax=Gossypium darwinii TaxID=34276 RepID=A0A5D2AZK8_GOSDA|nr:hypothetical protein ES288_D10G137500v1 [Gossypium darwinii]